MYRKWQGWSEHERHQPLGKTLEAWRLVWPLASFRHSARPLRHKPAMGIRQDDYADNSIHSDAFNRPCRFLGSFDHSSHQYHHHHLRPFLLTIRKPLTLLIIPQLPIHLPMMPRISRITMPQKLPPLTPRTISTRIIVLVIRYQSVILNSIIRIILCVGRRSSVRISPRSSFCRGRGNQSGLGRLRWR